MRRARHQLIIIICLYLFASLTSANAVAKDVSGMYSPSILEHWKGILEPWVNRLLKEEIEPVLWPKAKQVLQNTKIEVPTITSSNDPFDYYFKARSLTTPVLPLKFFYDLIAAHLWLEAHGFEDKSVPYVTALKYQEASAFPHGRYLSPFDALGVSHNEFMELTNNEPDTGRDFQQLFNGALLFILAHEVGHAVLSQKDETAVEREIEADMFAFEILARRRFNPAGVAWLFTYLSIWVPNAADFHTSKEYLDWIGKESHPFTGWRLEMVGSRLANEPQAFFPGVPDSDSRILMMKLVGSKLIGFGKDLDNLASRRELRDVALDIKVAELAVHKKVRSISSTRPETFSNKAPFKQPRTVPKEIKTIHDAVSAGDTTRIAEFLASNPPLMASEDSEGRTPLLLAAENGQNDILEFLLSKGGSVNEKNKEGFTPLHAAAAAQQTEMLKLLLSKGASVNARSERGFSPLSIAVAADYEEGVKLLIYSGAEINATDLVGLTPLHLAAEKGYTKIAALLLSKGANVNLADSTGFTPLLDAVRGGYQDLVELLLSKGADIESHDIGGFTPLHLAAFNGRKKIAQILISKGAKVSAKDENGDTPCQVALKRQETETAAILCAK